MSDWSKLAILSLLAIGGLLLIWLAIVWLVRKIVGARLVIWDDASTGQARLAVGPLSSVGTTQAAQDLVDGLTIMCRRMRQKDFEEAVADQLVAIIGKVLRIEQAAVLGGSVGRDLVATLSTYGTVSWNFGKRQSP